MREIEQEVVPAWVCLDGKNGIFDTYLPCEEVERINACGGLPNAERIILRETPEKKIPEMLTHGEALIKDILILVVPGPAYRG